MLLINLSTEEIKGMNYKTIQGYAKELGIKANQKKDVLVVEIEMELTNRRIAAAQKSLDAVLTGAVETKLPADVAQQFGADEVDEFEQFANGSVDLGASEASADVAEGNNKKEELEEKEMNQQPAYTKLFEYIDSNNLCVVFKQKGVFVKIGWSVATARPYIQVGDQPAKVSMIQTSIDKFKKFNNNVHGDVARIVKALVRIKAMPAQVLATKKQRERETKAASEASRNNNNNQRQQQNVSAADRKESTSKARYSGTIDASWLAQFRTEFETNEGRKPSGYEIREAWLNRVASN